MHYTTRNVNTAFEQLVSDLRDPELLANGTIVEVNTRNGKTRKFSTPVIVTYTHPRERVLFNSVRNCNPFFHLFESLWMLAGRNDLQPLLKYVSTFGNYSDDWETLNGAYGYRWRHAQVDDCVEDRVDSDLNGIDQLCLLVEHLRETPNSRRAVLQMWNVQDDLLQLDTSKDVCCNLSVVFSIRDPDDGLVAGPYHPTKTPGEQLSPKVLDMTVFNRSNDAIYGMLGANVVHFSFLQEYIACCLGIEVGQYHQISSDLHVYLDTNSGFHPEKWLEACTDTNYDEIAPWQQPFVCDRGVFDREVQAFVTNEDWTRNWSEPFLQRVAAPMCYAFELHKRRQYSMALNLLRTTCEAPDWRQAGIEWLQRRQTNWEQNHLKKD